MVRDIQRQEILGSGSLSIMKKAVFTIVSNNYMHFARTLLQSVRENDSHADLFCVVVDKDMQPASALADEFTTIQLDQLALPEGEHFLFQYTILELNTAVKPWAFEWLLNSGYDTVTYIDPDIFVFRPLNEVDDLLASSAEIVITPHLLAPIDDDKKPTELDIRRAGTYNFGFCAIRSSENTRKFLAWWQAKLIRDCVVDMERGIFVDQSWIDLVPGLFERVAILRHPGYNVAYWNLAQRSVTKKVSEGWDVEGCPLVFFHFSGFNPLNPEPFSKHQNRFTLSSLGASRELALAYADRLLDNGAQKYAKLPYGYGRFTDKTPIPDIFRRLYREDDSLRAVLGEHPFSRPDAMCLLAGNFGDRDARPTYAMLATWKSRADLQRTFPLNDRASVINFYHWFSSEGESYFSAAITEYHRNVVAKWDAAAAAAPGNNRVPQAEDTNAAAAARAERLFTSLLGRQPDAPAAAHYAALCKSRLGYAKALLSIGLSAESKRRPKLASRLLRASRRRSANNWYTPEPVDQGAAKSVYADASFSGIYPPDGDSTAAGFWVTDNVTLPQCGKPGDAVRIEGTYLPELIAKATNDPAAQFQIWCGDALIHQCEIRQGGDFVVEMTLPAASGHDTAALRIASSKAFIPKQIGLNGDERCLAWRLKRATVGNVDLFDCSRPKAYLPPAANLPAPGINIVGYIAAESGVGEGARSFAKGAVAGRVPYSVVDVGYQNENLQRDKSALAAAVADRFAIDMVYVNADQTPRTLDYLRQIGHRSQIKIAFWHWEQPELPLVYLNAFDGLAEVWVPSAFVQDAVAKISPVPVYKVPHVIEFSTSPGVSKASFGLPADRFAVLVMYDFHSYQYRKNPEAAIAAFRLAAANRKDALLVVKTINADRYPEKYALLKQSVADLDNILFMDRFLTRQEVYDLESVCDCMISLHRAEGFGLGPAEMMYLGKPVIATGWSANMEFMTPMNSFPVNYSLKTLEQSVGVYEAGQHWAEADIEHAASALTRLLEQPTLAREVGKRATESIRAQLSAQEVGRQYRSRLILLAQRHGL